MTAIQFYHLTATPLERALPKLLEKAVAGGFRTLLVDESDARVEQLNQLLWTYDAGSFLPHGSAKDGRAEEQPILLATPDYLASLTSPPCLRGGRGGDGATENAPVIKHGKIGEGEHSTRIHEALAHAKELRKNPTEPEKKLWLHLQAGNLGFSFRRQYPVGNYIADFACIEKHLIIELDGDNHAEQIPYDAQRTAFLEQAGYKVMRFWNNDVMENIEGVLQVIQTALTDASEGHPPCPPASGGVKRLLMVTSGLVAEKPEGFERIIDIFDGNDGESVAKARQRWMLYKNAGHALTYLKQTESGGWEQKAVA